LDGDPLKSLEYLVLPMRKILCWLIHRRKYVALGRAKSPACEWVAGQTCGTGFHPTFTIARWVCEKCNLMGEHKIAHGAWKIEFGRIVPDLKAWSNIEKT